MLPESAVDKREIDDLETLLHGHGVASLITGVRERIRQPGRFPGNWLHIGMNPRLEKGEPPAIGNSESWFHIRQNKLPYALIAQPLLDSHRADGGSPVARGTPTPVS